MLDPTLISAATATFEAAINKALDYDPATRLRLQQLQGRSLAVDLLELPVSLCIHFEADRVRLGTLAENPSTRLRGSLPALLRLARSERISLAQAGVSVSGDIDLLASVRALAVDLDIDWEQALSDWLGDIGARQLALGLRAQWQWLRERGASGRRLLGEFLSEELRAVPSAAELQHFNSQVDQLRLATDRVQARFELLRKRLARRHPS